MRAVPAGPDPILPPGERLLVLDGPGTVLTTLKPAELGTGVVVRVLNPTDAPAEVTLAWKMPVSRALSVRLDEEPEESSVQGLDAQVTQLSVPPHALRSVRVEHGR